MYQLYRPIWKHSFLSVLIGNTLWPLPVCAQVSDSFVGEVIGAGLMRLVAVLVLMVTVFAAILSSAEKQASRQAARWMLLGVINGIISLVTLGTSSGDGGQLMDHLTGHAAILFVLQLGLAVVLMAVGIWRSSRTE